MALSPSGAGAQDRVVALNDAARPSAGAALPRRIALPTGELLVRHVRPDDATALASLYDGLGMEGRATRFFTPKRPGASFFEHLASIADRGGAGIVAVQVSTPGGETGPIVGEASYELLEGGTGEMAITVDREWRGWLGAYLLASLSAVAAARGLPNLEARILTRNPAMRALTRARGEVYLPGSDWETVRVAFSTGGRMPGWSPTEDHPHVLLEMRGAPWAVLDGLRDAGYDVAACTGPATRRCPLLEGDECPLAAGADAIVLALPPDDRPDLLACAHAERHGDVPVTVIGPSAHRPITPDAVVDAVERALEDRT